MIAEGRLFTALSAKQRHGRPPGVSALSRDPHPITLRPLPPPPPPPPPPPRPPAHSTHSPIMQRGNRCRRHVTSGRRWLGRGRALVGAGGLGGHSRGISVTERLPLRRRGRAECWTPFWVWASCPFLLLPCESSSCCGEGRLSAFRLPLKLRSRRGTGAFKSVNDIVQSGPS